MFGVPKHIALKMAIKRNNLIPNTIIKLHKAQFWDWSNKNLEKWQKMLKFATFWAQKRLNDLLNLNYGLTTLNTWETAKNAVKGL